MVSGGNDSENARPCESSCTLDPSTCEWTQQPTHLCHKQYKRPQRKPITYDLKENEEILIL